MIDLHLHTTFSDGSEEPEEILIKAQEKGLKYISITDHDSIGAYKKLEKMKVKDYFSGKIIPGCEFSTTYSGQPIEVLGYGIDIETIEANGVISEEKFLERENRNLKTMMEVCRNIGIKYDNTISIKGGKYFATQVLYFNFKSYPENEKYFSKDIWESLNAFYRTCVNNKSNPFYIDQLKDMPSIHKIVKIIKDAGGKAFLAHLYGYYVDNYEEYLNSMITLDELHGIECYHSLHSMDKTESLVDYCHKKKLYMSGGSDYHGKIKPNVNIGESIPGVKIPYELSKDWILGCRIFN